MDESTVTCWVCGSSATSPYKSSDLRDSPSPNDFRITDSNYGVTGALNRCNSCGFIQATNLPSVLTHYEEMSDPGYEATRAQRSLQARKLLARLRLRAGARLLDVGAGSGILVEEALGMGIQAEGVEPSKWLAEQAMQRRIPVHLGTLENFQSERKFDVVTLVDVIEHVPDPVGLIRLARTFLTPTGKILVVTPDISSAVARMLGRKWWHFRIAHIGYFDLHNLDLAFGAVGMTRVDSYRPSWYFPVDYLQRRLARYLPFLGWIPLPARVMRFTVPLNLFDSVSATYETNTPPS